MEVASSVNFTCQAKPSETESWSEKLMVVLKSTAWLFRAVVYHLVEAILVALGFVEEGPLREGARDVFVLIFLIALVVVILHSIYQRLRRFSLPEQRPTLFSGHICGPHKTQTQLVCAECGRQSNFKTTFVIDMDCGIDAALALMLVLETKDWHLLAITCTHGVTTLDNTWQNIFRVLALYGDRKIPVYAGCGESILGYNKYNTYYHGEDGLGGDESLKPFTTRMKIEGENAVLALIRLSMEYSGNLSVLCLGPLTNVSLAQRLDPNFSVRLCNLIILGGNYHDHTIVAENVPLGPRNINGISEFNFECDPEAASIIIGEFLCPITCIPWEVCYNCNFPWKVVDEITCRLGNQAVFIKQITKNVRDLDNTSGFCPNAFLAVAALLDPNPGNHSRRRLTAISIRSTMSLCETATQRRHRLHGAPDIDIICKIDREKAIKLFKSIIK